MPCPEVNAGIAIQRNLPDPIRLLSGQARGDCKGPSPQPANLAQGQVENSMADPRWYLLRTKQHKECSVRDRLAGLVEDVLLPFLKMKRNYRGKVIERLVPLFPCYLFVFFDLKSAQHSIRRTFGVIDLISDWQ
jgi:hypothetical protein